MNSVLHNDKIIGAGVAPKKPRAPLRYYRNRLTRPRCGITVTTLTTQLETDMTQATATMVKGWLAMHKGDEKGLAYWMAQSMRIGSVRECRALIKLAISL